MRWKSAGDPEGIRVKKLSTRFSGRLPTTFSRASALPISRATYPEKLACTASPGLPVMSVHALRVEAKWSRHTLQGVLASALDEAHRAVSQSAACKHPEPHTE